jgi:hypothetical protein
MEEEDDNDLLKLRVTRYIQQELWSSWVLILETSSDYKMFTNLSTSALFDVYDTPPKFYVTSDQQHKKSYSTSISSINF